MIAIDLIWTTFVKIETYTKRIFHILFVYISIILTPYLIVIT